MNGSLEKGSSMVCGVSYKYFSILRASSERWEPAGDKAGKVATGQVVNVLSSPPNSLFPISDLILSVYLKESRLWLRGRIIIYFKQIYTRKMLIKEIAILSTKWNSVQRVLKKTWKCTLK